MKKAERFAIIYLIVLFSFWTIIYSAIALAHYDILFVKTLSEFGSVMFSLILVVIAALSIGATIVIVEIIED